MKRALIFGIGGMDGSYLADLLLAKGYQVYGTYRHSSVDNLARIVHCHSHVNLIPADIVDFHSVFSAVVQAEPDEIYNMADQDHVGYSTCVPLPQLEVTAGGCINVVEAARLYRPSKVRVFQPLSATMFGNAPPPQDENTPFDPQSPYACAKVAAHYICHYYRRTHGLFVATAIFFNHDSPRRGPGYLLQRIARGEKLTGSFDTLVDIGYAGEYVQAAWQILQLAEPMDFVIGTGTPYRIGDLLSDHPVSVSPAEWQEGLIAFTNKARTTFGFNPNHAAKSVLCMIKESLNASNR